MSEFADAIHIGFPKTGTTWLQQEVLGKDGRIACLGKPYLVDVAYRDIYNRLVSVNDFDFHADDFRQELRILAKKHANAMEGKSRVISFELFSGDLFHGLNAKQILERLKAVFGQTRIVITIREQTSEIESLYRHYVKEGGALHIRELLYKNRSPACDLFGQLHLFQKLRYDVVLDAYKEAFGSTNVHVVPFELLKHQGPRAYAEAFQTALGLTLDSRSYPKDKANENISYLGCNVLRHLNLVLCTPHSPSPILRPAGMYYNKAIFKPFRKLDDFLFKKFLADSKFVNKKTKWPLLRLAKKILGRHDPEKDETTLAQEIRKAYAASNRRTAEITGLDLKALGYAVSEE